MSVADQIEAAGVVDVRRGLALLRAWCASVGNYHAARPEVRLTGGGYLQPQLRKAEGGGELLGVWQIERRAANGDLTHVYQV